MTTTPELHVIFGAGPLGLAIMDDLAARGKSVRVINRSGRAKVPLGVEVRAADATDVNSARDAAEGADVIYNCLNPGYTEWLRLFPSLQAGALDAAESTGAKLISGDNLYMYGKVNAPMTETTPNNAHTRKGALRARMAETLMEAHAQGRARIAIARASDFFGPRALLTAVGDRVFYRALAGKPAQIMGDLDALHTYTFIRDFARGMVILGERDEALGQIWHIPSAETLTTRQFLTLVCEEAGQVSQMSSAPSLLVHGMGLISPIMRELAEMLYEFEEPFVVDHSKFEGAFGNISTPHREAIRETLQWFRENPQPTRKQQAV